MDNPILWTPSQARLEQTSINQFIRHIQKLEPSIEDFGTLYQWSLSQPEIFWEEVRKFVGIEFSCEASKILEKSDTFYLSQWFPGALLNFAKHLLEGADNELALIFHGEDKVERQLTYAELRSQVSSMQQFLLDQGIVAGDRVAAVLPNMPETIVAMLAATSIGAVWSSCSPDFGETGILDRFVQIEPKVLLLCDGYYFKGKWIDCTEKFKKVLAKLSTVKSVIHCSYSGKDFSDLQTTSPDSISLGKIRETYTPDEISYIPVPFSHPLYIMFSSGTTGKPKCIVHSTGGVLLEHKKELTLHSDIQPGDVFFYQTTCGWMMWNWLVSGLSVGATLLLYDGSPFHEDGHILWRLAQDHRVNIFGTNAKYLSALEKAGVIPADTYDLSSLKTILSTGSTLLPESFDYVYSNIKKDVCLCSISGGTDILGCFALGCPTLPVRRSELQCRSLGLDVQVFSSTGEQCLAGEQGELVCTAPFPSMPVMFWNDETYEKYHSSYFARFPGVWTHGDFVTLTEHGGMIFYGRSDATLNPGGVRIGTAEIYQQVEKFDAVEESIVIGQNWKDDVRIVLFVVLRNNASLSEDLEREIRQTIRNNTSPFHVPKKIIQIPAIPRTRSGKIVEIAVRDIVAGKTNSNTEALMNPEALEHFKNIPSLYED